MGDNMRYYASGGFVNQGVNTSAKFQPNKAIWPPNTANPDAMTSSMGSSFWITSDGIQRDSPWRVGARGQRAPAKVTSPTGQGHSLPKLTPDGGLAAQHPAKGSLLSSSQDTVDYKMTVDHNFSSRYKQTAEDRFARLYRAVKLRHRNSKLDSLGLNHVTSSRGVAQTPGKDGLNEVGVTDAVKDNADVTDAPKDDNVARVNNRVNKSQPEVTEKTPSVPSGVRTNHSNHSNWRHPDNGDGDRKYTKLAATPGLALGHVPSSHDKHAYGQRGDVTRESHHNDVTSSHVTRHVTSNGHVKDNVKITLLDVARISPMADKVRTRGAVAQGLTPQILAHLTDGKDEAYKRQYIHMDASQSGPGRRLGDKGGDGLSGRMNYCDTSTTRRIHAWLTCVRQERLDIPVCGTPVLNDACWETSSAGSDHV